MSFTIFILSQTAPVIVTGPVTTSKTDQIHSNVQITLCYVGKSVNLSGFRSGQQSQVVVLQQHCGGNTVTLYKGSVRPKGIHLYIYQFGPTVRPCPFRSKMGWVSRSVTGWNRVLVLHHFCIY